MRQGGVIFYSRQHLWLVVDGMPLICGADGRRRLTGSRFETVLKIVDWLVPATLRSMRNPLASCTDNGGIYVQAMI